MRMQIIRREAQDQDLAIKLQEMKINNHILEMKYCNQLKSQKSNLQQTTSKFDSLTNTQILAYGLGHCLNDLTAACWFNYLLFFLTTVVHTPAAPLALLIGQIADGLATPLVGFLSDKYTSRFGKRTPWYIFGAITITLCFPPLFIPLNNQETSFEYLYYSVFPGLFNIGWACLQISHMSLVPALSCSRKRRDRLNNYRNSFAFVSNLFVLTLGLCVFSMMNNKEAEYQLISVLVILVGLCCSFFFLYQVNQNQLVSQCKQKKEKLKHRLSHCNKQNEMGLAVDNILSQRSLKKAESQQTADSNINVEDAVITEQKKDKSVPFSYWLKKPSFYLYGLCYMCVRLNTNIFGTFLPFYLLLILKLTSEQEINTVPFEVALVPLIIYFSSSMLSMQLGKLYSFMGRRKTFLVGTFLSVLSLSGLYSLQQSNNSLIYAIAIPIGFSQSMVLSTGINLISDVVGNKGESGAVVFGIYSFLDKISAGIFIYFLATLPPFISHMHSLSQAQTFTVKFTVLVIPMLTAIVGASFILFARVSEYLGEKQGLSESKMQYDQFVHSVTLR